MQHDKKQLSCTNYPYQFDDDHQGENQIATLHKHATAIILDSNTSLGKDRFESSADNSILLDKEHHIKIHLLLPCK